MQDADDVNLDQGIFPGHIFFLNSLFALAMDVRGKGDGDIFEKSADIRTVIAPYPANA
jgi:hypothetical protein